MFTREELDIIFKVFSELETEDNDTLYLKDKMLILDKQRQIGDKANEDITELQNELKELEDKHYKVEEVK